MIDGSGQTRWQANIPAEGPDSQASPVGDRLTVYANEGDQLGAYDLSTGRWRWQVHVSGPVYGEWLTPNGVLAVVDQVSDDARIMLLDPGTGVLRWSVAPPGRLVGDQYPTGDGGLLTVAGGGTLSVIDTATGHVRWSAPAAAQPGMVALAGSVVVANAGASFVARSLATGKVVWHVPEDPRSAPLIVGGVVTEQAAVSPDGAPLTGYAVASGRQLWRLGEPVDPGLGSRYATSAGLVTAAADGAGFRITLADPGTGRPRWTVASGPIAPVTPPMVVGDELVTVEGGALGDPNVDVVSHRLNDGTVAGSVDLGPLSALGAVPGSHDDLVVRVARGNGEHLIDVAGRVPWDAVLPASANRNPVVLPDGALAIQVASPPLGCALSEVVSGSIRG